MLVLLLVVGFFLWSLLNFIWIFAKTMCLLKNTAEDFPPHLWMIHRNCWSSQIEDPCGCLSCNTSFVFPFNFIFALFTCKSKKGGQGFSFYSVISFTFSTSILFLLLNLWKFTSTFKFVVSLFLNLLYACSGSPIFVR